MITSNQLLLFWTTSLILIITPGPDLIYVLTRGMAQGRRAAVSASAGFSLGNFVHIFLALVGVSKIITSNKYAFTVLKYLGVAYLVFLGVKMIRDKSSLVTNNSGSNKKLVKIFIESFTANILNPKVIIFFLAFFPQFISKDLGRMNIQMLTLGIIFVVTTFFCFSSLGLCSAFVTKFLHKKPDASSRVSTAAGVVLILLGLRLLIV